MIAGLPVESWVLLILSVGIGLAIELRFYLAHSSERRERLRQPREPGREGRAEP